MFTCPVCSERRGAAEQLLTREGNALKCPEGHSFDISAKGYVNLLLPQHKNVKDPGDSKEMASARREFLGTGAYEPLRDGLCKAVADSLADFSESGKAPIILDCGCGEGYYTAGIYDNLLNSGISPEIYGIDISKNVLSAAKPRFVGKKIYCAVASCFRLPLPSESVDLATVIFAPFCREELLRTLKTGGIAVTAIPAREHLYELKELLYKEPYYNSVKPYETDGFDFIGKSEIAYNLTIDSQEILNALFMMTPYFYKTSREDSNRLYSYFGTNDKFTTRIAFEILTYVKK